MHLMLMQIQASVQLLRKNMAGYRMAYCGGRFVYWIIGWRLESQKDMQRKPLLSLTGWSLSLLTTHRLFPGFRLSRQRGMLLCGDLPLIKWRKKCNDRLHVLLIFFDWLFVALIFHMAGVFWMLSELQPLPMSVCLARGRLAACCKGGRQDCCGLLRGM